MTTRRTRCAAGLAVLVLVVAGCGDDKDAEAVIDPGDDGVYAPRIDPAEFVDVIDNPYLPLAAGSRWRYEGETEDGFERIDVVVTDEQRTVMGVAVTVVRDTVRVNDEVVEDTLDWFAQDRDGTVWYFGEDSKDYENGEVASTEGSWEAGIDGALPGIVMPANPKVGVAYRQEYYKGEAEDMGKVIRVGEHTSVTFGDFDAVVVTRDWNPLEPDVIEEKYYAPGIGLVFETTAAGGDEQAELVEHDATGGRVGG